MIKQQAQKQAKNITILNYKNLDELNAKFFTHKPMNLLNKYKKSKVRSQEREEVVNSYVDREIHRGSKRRYKFSLPGEESDNCLESPKFQIEDKWMNEK